MWLLGLPIWVSTLSSHCRGPCRWISIQQGVEVTSWKYQNCKNLSCQLVCTAAYLSVVFSAPTLHKRHPDGAHLGQLVHSLEAVVDGLSEQSGELLVIENFQTAAGRNLADGGGVEAVVVVTVP